MSLVSVMGFCCFNPFDAGLNVMPT
jgi:hypothetical protein